MYIKDNSLFSDQDILIFRGFEKLNRDVEVFAYYVAPEYQEHGEFEVYIEHNPYPDNTKEGLTFLGSVIVPADPELVLADRKVELMTKLFSKVGEISKKMESGFSSLEKESWVQQEKEARELLAVKTPLIDVLCEARGCSRDYLAQRIVANADDARNAGIFILGWQQSTEELIKKMSLEDFSLLWSSIDGK